MTTRDEAQQALHAFLQGSERFLFLNGTFQNEKHVLVLNAVGVALHRPATILFRSNSSRQTDGFLKPTGIPKSPKPGQHLDFNGHRLYADTIQRSSWKKSPAMVDVAIVYPIDSMGGDEGSECVADLIRRKPSKIILVTWTDNRDFSWAQQFRPLQITFDAKEERPDYHQRMQEYLGRKLTPAPLRDLPGYAKQADPQRLVRLHCNKCGSSRWAEMDVPYPGKLALESGDTIYTATCLMCGTSSSDSYNWYGRD